MVIAIIAVSSVAPLAGAWIEILLMSAPFPADCVAPLAGAWIEIVTAERLEELSGSLPSRERGLKCI